jgi:hypothetical protein
MYEKWAFDETKIQEYWEIQIARTLTLIQNVYNIRLEAERRYLIQQYEHKVGINLYDKLRHDIMYALYETN